MITVEQTSCATDFHGNRKGIDGANARRLLLTRRCEASGWDHQRTAAGYSSPWFLSLRRRGDRDGHSRIGCAHPPRGMGRAGFHRTLYSSAMLMRHGWFALFKASGAPGSRVVGTLNVSGDVSFVPSTRQAALAGAALTSRSERRVRSYNVVGTFGGWARWPPVVPALFRAGIGVRSLRERAVSWCMANGRVIAWIFGRCGRARSRRDTGSLDPDPSSTSRSSLVWTFRGASCPVASPSALSPVRRLSANSRDVLLRLQHGSALSSSFRRGSRAPRSRSHDVYTHLPRISFSSPLHSCDPWIDRSVPAPSRFLLVHGCAGTPGLRDGRRSSEEERPRQRENVAEKPRIRARPMFTA